MQLGNIHKTELSEEILKNLKNMPDIIEFVVLFKNNGAKYYDVIPKPFQYKSVTNRKKALVRLGMISVDIAYLKIIGGKFQIPEYEEIFRNYINELNLNSIFKKINSDYIEKLAAGELDINTLNELKERWRRERAGTDRQWEVRRGGRRLA